MATKTASTAISLKKARGDERFISLEAVAQLLHYKDSTYRQFIGAVKRGVMPQPEVSEYLDMYFSKEKIMQWIGAKDLNEPFIGMEHACSILGVNKDKLVRMCRNKEIPLYQIFLGENKRCPKYLFRASEIVSARNISIKWNIGFYSKNERVQTLERIAGQIIPLKISKSILGEKDHLIVSRRVLESKTFEEIGAEFDLTRERIRQIYEVGFRRLHRVVKEIGLRLGKYEAMQAENMLIKSQVFALEVQNAELRKKFNRQNDLPPVISSNPVVVVPENPDLAKAQKFLLSKIQDLDLSVRALNCIEAANVSYGYELTSLSKHDLLKFRNFGPKSLKEIEEVMAENKVSFGFAQDVIRGAHGLLCSTFQSVWEHQDFIPIRTMYEDIIDFNTIRIYELLNDWAFTEKIAKAKTPNLEKMGHIEYWELKKKINFLISEHIHHLSPIVEEIMKAYISREINKMSIIVLEKK